jgi:uncharacterized protein (TIGR03437 family)
VTIGGIPVAPEYAGPEGGGLPGLDQLNLLLPSSLKGKGVVNATVRVDGLDSNTVRLAFQP